MKNLLRLSIALFVGFGFNQVCAVPGAQHGSFQLDEDFYEYGNWDLVCTAFTSVNIYISPYWFKSNLCTITAPGGTGGSITSYGIYHLSSGYSHWGTDDPEFDSQLGADSNGLSHWQHTGSASHSTNTQPIVEHDTAGLLYWEDICEDYLFYAYVGPTLYEIQDGNMCNFQVKK